MKGPIITFIVGCFLGGAAAFLAGLLGATSGEMYLAFLIVCFTLFGPMK